MTYVKKLELHGFKSFSNKTTITFPKSVSCVVGSNGSGKSNISEAINFVIGKSSKKDLRAEKMTDFIFNGGKTGKPAQQAKVKIVFDNEDGTFPIKEKELSVSRVVSKKGSMYILNGQRTTREEVLSMLTKARVDPDGHNIILQGEIQNFVNLDPTQRRLLMEEISGISVYEDKKQKSLHSLRKVEDKIKEASIILAEKRKLLDELEEQKKRAEEFKNSEIEFRKSKAFLLFKEIEDLNVDKKKIEDKIDEIKARGEKYDDEIRKGEKQIDKNTERIQEILKETKDKGFEQNSEIKVKITNLENQISIFEKEIKNVNEQIKRAKESRENTKKELQSLNQELSNRTKELSDIRQNIDSFKKESESKQEIVDDLTVGTKFKNLEKESGELLTQIYDYRGKINILEAKLNQLSELDDREREAKTKKKEERSVDIDIETKLEESSKLSLKQHDIEKKIQETNQGLYNLKTKLKLSYDVLGSGVKEVLKLRDSSKIKGIIGTMHELGKVEKKYSLALTVAAGQRILNVVVKTSNVAKNCITHLKTNRIGKATFLPLTDLKRPYPLDRTVLREEGVVGYAVELIHFDKDYLGAFNTILRDTLVVQDFETAKRLGVGRKRMVTLDGELFETSGAITGGSRNVEKLIGFKESTPEDEVKAIEAKLEEYQKYHTNVLKDKEQNEKELLRLRELKAKLQTEKDFLESRVEELKEATLGFNKREYNELKQKLKSSESQKQKVDLELSKKPDETSLEEVRKEIKKLSDEIEELNKKETEINSKIEFSIKRDITSFESSLKTSEAQESNFLKSQKEYQKELDNLDKDVKEQKKIQKEFLSSLSHLAKEQEKLETQNKQLDEKIDKLRLSSREIVELANKRDLERAKIVSKVEGLNEQLKEFSEIKIKSVKESITDLKTKISSLEVKVNKLKQNVNLGAWETYKETEKEYNDISNKTQILINEQTEIMDVIDEIEKRKKEAFMETFNEINKYFDLYFKRLSVEGEAKLIIQNEEEIFTAGIDILARPSGKKMVSMKSMSGGEKSITALAFIFAIQHYSPAPFYVLDEVDAALDKMNSQVFAGLIQENSQYAQFIVVTHNEDVIAAADILYGVYLVDKSYSKIVSLVLPKTKEDFDKIKKDMEKKS